MITIYGNDAERIIKFVSEINSTMISVINSLATVTIGDYPVNIRHITNPVLIMNTTMQIINNEILLIVSKSSKSIYIVNNSYGSPYTELYNLTNSLVRCANIVNRYPSVNDYSDISEIIDELNESSYYTTDAKYSVIIYNEHIQQGYDKIIHKVV